ncbi:MAG TPA: right-handed parallel beta-helix repeat-containing protein, partial [Blastocatellia bacterium]|nr:right-handed parallel beta-helix repeat-containing protein [Blastocatellia bacterium]
FVVNKSVTIIASQGVYAGVSVSSGDGITINAGPSDVIILRGLTVNGVGGANGIVFNSGQTLFVERCNINGFTANGLNFAGGGRLFARDSNIRNNVGSGITISGSVQAVATASIDRVRLEANGTGLAVLDRAKASVRNSVGSGNTTGFAAAPSTAPAEINIEKCLVANNNTGARAQGSGGGIGTLRISKSVIVENGLGLSAQPGGVLLSGGHNKLGGNTTDSSGTVGSYTPR